MSRGPYTFRERDLTRAIRAAAKAGVPFSGVKVDRDGSIVILIGTPSSPAPANDNHTVAPAANEWDEVLQ
jgi:hypothetical protein